MQGLYDDAFGNVATTVHDAITRTPWLRGWAGVLAAALDEDPMFGAFQQAEDDPFGAPAEDEEGYMYIDR